MRRRWFGIGGTAALVLAATVGAAAHATPVSATWTVRNVPLPAGLSTDVSSEARVSCASDAQCALVVSSVYNGHRNRSVAALLRGGVFRAPTVLPDPPGNTSSSTVGGVACLADGTCFAAGAEYPFGLVETLAGKTWTATAPPNPSTRLVDAACAPTICAATGYFQDYEDQTPIMVTRDNATGTLTSTRVVVQNPAAAPAARSRYQDRQVFASPACAPSGPCYGIYDGSYLAFPSGGGYTAVPMPVPNGIVRDDLYVSGGMSCAAATDCAALGTYLNPTATQQFLVAEVLRAGTLEADTIAIPAELRRLGDPLQAREISCPAVDRCVGVVGFHNSTAQHGALVVRYNGTKWWVTKAALPADAAGADAGDLTGISCTTTAVCEAVGTYRTAAGQLRPLIETLNKSTSTPIAPAVPDGTPSDADVTLQDVSCAQSTCLASGFAAEGDSSTPIVAVATR